MKIPQLTDIQKDLLLFEETERQFGYRPENLSCGSKKKVLHKCGVCGQRKETQYKMFLLDRGTAHHKCGYIKRVQTYLDRYGVECPNQSAAVQEKRKQTCLEKYGVEHPNQSKKVQKKKRKVWLQKINQGVSGVNIREDLKQLLLSEETFQKYGYKIESLCAGSPQKIIHKCDVCGQPKESYFREFIRGEKVGHVKCSWIKHEQTFLKRYGVKHPRQLKEVVEKAIPKRLQTWLRAQGVEHLTEGIEVAVLNYLRQELQKEGYQLISTRYLNTTTKMETLCPRKHTYWVKWNDFQSGSRCADCKAENNKITMEEVRIFLEGEGYQLLSEYVDRTSLFDYKCPEGHKDQTRWYLFKAGHRCPECREWKSQKKLGEILEQIYPLRVKRGVRFDFLKGLELDYAIENEKLAFEYDGQQHFMPLVGPFGCKTPKEAKQRLRVQQKRDKRKNRLCKKNGYRLIRVAYNEKLCLDTIQQKLTN